MLGSKIKRSQPSLPPNVASPTESPCKYTSAETQPFSADLKKWKWVEGRQFDECVCGDSPNPCDGKSLSALLCLVSFGAFEEWSCCSVLCVSFLWGSTLYNKYAIYTYMYVYVCIYIYVYIWDVYPISPLICFLRNSNWLLWFCYEKNQRFFLNFQDAVSISGHSCSASNSAVQSMSSITSVEWPTVNWYLPKKSQGHGFWGRRK